MTDKAIVQSAPTEIATSSETDAERLIALALSREQPLDVAALTALLDMRRELKAEQARESYFAALAEFQSKCPTIVNRDEVRRANGGLLYKFAPLEEIVSEIRDLEHSCGFSHRFETAPQNDGSVVVTCVVTHRSGHREKTEVNMPATKGQNTNSCQDRGIQIKYGMRYALVGAFGIVTADTDTDGRLPAEPPQTISADQAGDLKAMIDEVNADLSRFLAYFKINSLSELPMPRYSEAVQMLERKRRGATR